ncbi:MAG: CapA family protein, partial [Candidatus Lokiarchaeota archaeon]|nr:CapA family protein [Candidatus Lokiarchaeota archaeon]
MELQTIAGKSLDDYYSSPEGRSGGEDEVIKAEKWGISPYEIEETIYYFGKHLALPGIAGVLIPLTIIFGIFDNSLIAILSYIIYALAAILLLSVGRELIRGWRYKIKEGAIYLPGPYYFRREAEDYTPRINEISKPKYKIGFVGDIMKMNDFDLEFHPDIKKFFEDTDLIIGNLEGIIKKPCPRLKQAHKDDILEKLESLLSDNTKWLLCLSNNHGEDFSNTLFNQTIQTIQENPKFDVFGRREISFIQNATKDLTIACATQWSNQKTWNYTFKYTNPEIEINNYVNNPKYPFLLIQNNKFNILLPHWGFENEKYVRTRFQKDAKALLTGKLPDYKGFKKIYKRKLLKGIFAHPNHKWDLIFAHHPHVLQPIMMVPDEFKPTEGKSISFNKVVVFSAGNFTSGANIIRKKKHISGIIIKCEIGPLKECKEK